MPRRAWLGQGLNRMALIRRPRLSADAGSADSLLERLRASRLFQDVKDKALQTIVAEASWFTLPGGATLPRDGDNDQAMFLVLTGSVGVFVRSDGADDMMVASVPAGETVGEMALLSGESHSASIVALRDSELLRIPKDLFDAMVMKEPRIMLNLTQLLIQRLRETTRRAASRQGPKTFALIPLQAGLQCTELCEAIRAHAQSLGLRVIRLDSRARDEASDWFQRIETQHDMVLYEGDAPESSWTQLCLRQADRILLVASCSRSVPIHPITSGATTGLRRNMPETILLHEDGTLSPGRAAPLLQVMPSALHHHVRAGRKDDLERLARFLSGRAVALVLAGGGARGFAHLGVMEALSEMKIPIDILGGASMGGIVAAGIAMDWSIEELTQRLKRTFVDTNPLNDYTFPLFSLVRGRKVTRLLHENFGDHHIEDLARPFFCVSSNLTTGHTNIHRGGLVWRALRASVAIPGLLPPVIQDGQMLVDGGLMNNFPVDIMAQIAQGPIIGIDVSGDSGIMADADYDERPWLSLLRRGAQHSPTIVSILMRSGTVGNEAQRRSARAMTDLLFDPPLEGVGLRTWRRFDAAIEGGYRHAVDVIQSQGLPPALARAIPGV